MSARVTAILRPPPPPPETALAPTAVVQDSDASGSLTVAYRRPSPRRVRLWVADLSGEQIGVIS